MPQFIENCKHFYQFFTKYSKKYCCFVIYYITEILRTAMEMSAKTDEEERVG